MVLPVTEALAKYLDNLGCSMETLAERAGGGLTTWYRLRRMRKGWLNEETAAMLARGLGVTEEELLRIVLGLPPSGPDHPCVGKPKLLSDLCRVWGDLDDSTQEMVAAVIAAAIKKASAGGNPGIAESA